MKQEMEGGKATIVHFGIGASTSCITHASYTEYLSYCWAEHWKAGRGPRRDREDPPEIAAARKLVQDYDDRIEAEWDAVEEAMDKLAAWVAEQVLFTSAQQALQFVKAYESLTGEQAMQAARSMEDRNDIPLGLPGCTDV